MSHVILLDRFQNSADQYLVSFAGSFAACEAQASHDNQVYPIPKSTHSRRDVKSKALKDPFGNLDDGVIAELTRIQATISTPPPNLPEGR